MGHGPAHRPRGCGIAPGTRAALVEDGQGWAQRLPLLGCPRERKKDPDSVDQERGLASKSDSDPGPASVASGFSALQWWCWAPLQTQARESARASCFPRAHSRAATTSGSLASYIRFGREASAPRAGGRPASTDRLIQGVTFVRRQGL